MSNFMDAYNYAQNVVANRRTEDFARFDKNLATITSKVPEVREIYNELNEIQSELVRAAFSGELDAEKLDKIKSKQEVLSENLKNTLIKNGYPADFLEIKYTCKLCADTGIHNGETCECFNKIVNDYNFKELCGESRVENCTFDNFSLDYYSEAENEYGISPKCKMKEIYDYCVKYVNDFSYKPQNILMYGETGLGKTHLSLAIAAEVSKKGYKVIYGSAQNLLRKVEKEHFSGGNDETINSLLECDLLVLDDLGTEFESKFNASQVYNIINTRLNFSLPTIISTNLTMTELEERYEQRVVSRLIGEYDVLMFIGNDVRQIKKKIGK